MKLGGHELIQHRLYRGKETELTEIYEAMSIKTLAISLVGIFTPIYLLNVGFTFPQVLLIDILMFSLEFLLEIPAANFAAKFGPKHSIAFSMPFYAVHYIIIWLMGTFKLPIWPIVVTGGIATAFFWEGYHWDFSHAKHRSSATSEVGKMNIFSIIIAACAPMIGGLLGGYWGMPSVFLITAVLLLLSVAPLFKTAEPHRSKKLNFGKVKARYLWRELVAYGGEGIQNTIGATIWPIFIYLIIRNYQTLGFITTVASLLAILITYIIGKKADQRERRKYVKSGSYLMSGIYLVKALANTILDILSLNVLTSLASSISTSPFTSEYYLHADEESRSEFIALMESSIDLFRVLVLTVLFGLTFLFTVKTVLVIGLVLGGVGSLMMTIMPPAKCEERDFSDAAIKVMPHPVKKGTAA